MMEPPGGTALVEESILEALDFRRAMRKVDDEWGKDWWFKVWGPDKVAADGIGSREEWVLKANEKWHGFGNLAPGFNMLDPIKATVITPGLDVSGKFAKTGIPAAIVTRYLAEHGVIVEKTGLYSFFIMFTIGITKGRWNTLVTALQQFKDDYDKNQPIWRVLPEFCQAYPRYERLGIRDLCDQIHGMYKANDVARVTTEMYLSDMQPAMKPSDAFAAMAHREIDRVEIDKLEGRVTSVLLTPYPPGIPLLIPGERFNATIVSYLKFAREFNRKFPGFETDIHGLVEEPGGRGDGVLHRLRPPRRIGMGGAESKRFPVRQGQLEALVPKPSRWPRRPGAGQRTRTSLSNLAECMSPREGTPKRALSARVAIKDAWVRRSECAAYRLAGLTQRRSGSARPSLCTSARSRSGRRRSGPITPKWPRRSTTGRGCTALTIRALSNHPDTAQTLANLSVLYRIQERYGASRWQSGIGAWPRPPGGGGVAGQPCAAFRADEPARGSRGHEGARRRDPGGEALKTGQAGAVSGRTLS